DSALTTYGATVVDFMRSQATLLRSVTKQLVALEQQRQYAYYQEPVHVNYYWGGWTGGIVMPTPTGTPTFNFGVYPGNFYYMDNFAQINQQQRQTVSSVRDEFNRVAAQMQQERDRVRRAMSLQFGVNFPR